MRWKVLLCLCVLVIACGSDEVLLPEEEMVAEADPITEAEIAFLITQLDDSTLEIRRTAALKLAQINDPAIVPALIKALGDENEEIQTIAAEALVKIGEPAVPALLRAGDEWIFWHISRQGVAGVPLSPTLPVVMIAEIGTPAIPVLLDALENKDELVANNAAYALGLMEDVPAELALEIIDRLMKIKGHPASWAWPKLVEFVLPTLIEQLHSKDERARHNAASKLEGMGKPARNAVPWLIEALDDESEKVSQRAYHALRNMGTPEALQATDEFREQAKKLKINIDIHRITTKDGQPIGPGHEIKAGTIIIVGFDKPPTGVNINGRDVAIKDDSTVEWQIPSDTPPGDQSFTFDLETGNEQEKNIDWLSLKIVE